MNRSVSLLDKSKLHIDNSYQREREEAFDPEDYEEELFLTLVVYQRSDGSYWIVDGQGRWKAAMMMTNVDVVPCDIRISKGVEHESRRYRELNDERLRMKRKDIFKARIAEKDPEALELKQLLEPLNNYYDSAIGILMDAFKGSKKESFRRVWPLVVELYKNDPADIDGHFIRGFIHLEKKLGDQVSLVNFKNRILSIGRKELEKTSKTEIAKTNNSAGNVSRALKERILNVQE